MKPILITFLFVLTAQFFQAQQFGPPIDLTATTDGQIELQATDLEGDGDQDVL